MRRAIQILAENYNTPLEELTEYRDIVEQNLDQPELYSIISEQFRPTSIQIGTAGAYLWGCDQNYYGTVSKSCSALCNGGIAYRNTQNTCQYQIWIYNKILKLKETAFSSKAYIYVESDWIGFQQADIEILKTNQVEYATILKTQNSQHEIILSITQVDNLPIVKEFISEPVQEVQSSSTYWWIILFILIIFITTMLYKSE